MTLSSLLVQLREYDAALLANTLGYFDPTPAHELYMSRDIQTVTPTLGPTVGVAATCQIDTSSPDGTTDMTAYWKQLGNIEQMEEPAIWVVQTVGSRPDHECVIGDGMAKTLDSVGCIGTVTDGGVRDVEGLLSIPFAAYSRGVTVHHTAMRAKAIDTPVEIGGLTISPGDIIHASGEGVIRIPADSLEALIEKAPKMRAAENEAHALCRRQDVSLDEKRQRVGEILAKHGFMVK